MTETTLTFTVSTNQAKVNLVTDPSKPGWEDFLASNQRDDMVQEEKERVQREKS